MALFEDILRTTFEVLGLEKLVGAFQTAIQVTEKWEASTFRAQIILTNLGSSLNTTEILRYGAAVEHAGTVSRIAFTDAAAILARTGLGGGAIEQSFGVIADAATATGQSVEQMATRISLATLNPRRALRDMGISFETTGSRALNFQRILQQLNLRFEGANVAFRGTLPGAFAALQNSFANFAKEFGDKIAPEIIRFINGLIKVLDFFADHADAIVLALRTIFDPITLFLEATGILKDPRPKPGQVGHGGDPATERTALQIADNTAEIKDKLIERVLGVSGQSFAQVGFRDFQFALKF